MKLLTPERVREIEVVLDALRVAAQRRPLLRIGQLIDNALVYKQTPRVDLFQVADGKLAGLLLDFDPSWRSDP